MSTKDRVTLGPNAANEPGKRAGVDTTKPSVATPAIDPTVADAAKKSGHPADSPAAMPRNPGAAVEVSPSAPLVTPPASAEGRKT